MKKGILAGVGAIARLASIKARATFKKKSPRYAMALGVEDVHHRGHGEHRGNLSNEGELKEYRRTLSGIVGAQW
jgi:hypothetical protein